MRVDQLYTGKNIRFKKFLNYFLHKRFYTGSIDEKRKNNYLTDIIAEARPRRRATMKIWVKITIEIKNIGKANIEGIFFTILFCQ